MNEKLHSAVAKAVHGALSKCDVMNYLNMPDDTAEKVAQAAIAATFAFIREQAGREDVVEAGWEALALASTNESEMEAAFRAMLDQIEGQNDE